jgi:hypothetical protein
MAIPEMDARFPVFHDRRNHDRLKVSPFLTPKIKMDPENLPTCFIFTSSEPAQMNYQGRANYTKMTGQSKYTKCSNMFIEYTN